MTNGLQTSTGEETQSDAVLPQSRRKILGWLVAAINLVVGAVVVGPVLGFIGAPLRRRSKSAWIPLLNESELAIGETREAPFLVRIRDGYADVDRKYSVFLHRTANEVIAFDPACTHLGCRIKWVGDKNRYFCPCHGGVFDSEGRVVSGPPPSPLVRHRVKIEHGKIFVEKSV